MFTSDQLQAIRTVIASECDRQHVGEDRREFLLSAYLYAAELRTRLEHPTAAQVLTLAGMLEPDNGGAVRRTPVTFANGGSSASPDTVEHLFLQLVENFPAPSDAPGYKSYWLKEFLWTHPFQDGNGRLGFLLHNWLRNGFGDPQPLPYFFGEGEQETERVASHY